MCRLFALISNQKTSYEFAGLMVPFRTLSTEHPDGWGVAWYNDGRIRLERTTLAAKDDPQFPTLCSRVRSNIIIAHVRKASSGGVTMENTHPFVHDRWSFEHNGTIDRKGPILHNLPDAYRERIRGNTDSEIFFQWLLCNIGGSDGVEDGIRHAVEFVDENKGTRTTALNFILSDGKTVYAYRRDWTKTGRYALSYTVREPRPDRPFRSIILCSEALSKEDWRSFDNNQLMVVDEDQNISLRTL